MQTRRRSPVAEFRVRPFDYTLAIAEYGVQDYESAMMCKFWTSTVGIRPHIPILLETALAEIFCDG